MVECNVAIKNDILEYLVIWENVSDIISKSSKLQNNITTIYKKKKKEKYICLYGKQTERIHTKMLVVIIFMRLSYVCVLQFPIFLNISCREHVFL